MFMKKTALLITWLVLTAGVTSAGLFDFWRTGGDKGPVTEQQLNQGLVLHMTFERDETAGRVADTSGCGNDGRATGVRWTPDGKKGGAYEFTADGDQILVPNSPSLNPGRFTLSSWIKTTTGDHYWRRIFDKSYTREFALSVAGDWQNNKYYGQVSMEIGPGTHFALTTKRVDDGQWHHVATTLDGTNEVVYVDGQVAAQTRWQRSGKAGTTDFDLVIGCNRSNLAKSEDDLGVSFRGMISQPMIWSRALSPEEVAFLFRSQQ